jgi:predicted ATPase/transcriptional regulator with XRE-family HTH domain
MAGDEVEAFGALLRRYRQAAALSQEVLAERAGISSVAVSALERGVRRAPYLGTVELLAGALALDAKERAALLAAARPAGDGSGSAALEPPPSPVAHPIPEATRARPATERAVLAPDGLPGVPTPLIGREMMLAAVVALLVNDPHADGGAAPGTRLLTLTGPGGVGKTRLALHAARVAQEHHADGVAFVDLAPLQDAGLVAATIARALGVTEQGSASPREALVAFLRPRQALLLLDNAEQVLEAVADEAAALHAACPGLRLLVTSRAALHLRGEQVYAIPPLAVPEPGSERSLAALSAVPAAALFVQRARAVRPDFTLEAQNAAAVAAICRRLDGLPLAIELAAARVGVLSVGQLLTRLDQALGVLTGGARDLPARQRTLRATLEWSAALLGADQRALFGRLGVFVGGATLETVEAVCAEPGGLDVLAVLSVLVEQSLLRMGDEEPPRYRMLETVHEYARELLQAGDIADTLRRAHAAHYLALAEEIGAAAEQSDPAHWLNRLETEHDNLRAALRWSVQGGDPAIGLRLVVALQQFWTLRGHMSEGRRWQTTALAAAGPSALPSVRAAALNGAGGLAWQQGDLGAAAALLEKGLALYRALGDPRGIADTLRNLAVTAGLQANYVQANIWSEEGLALYRSLGRPQETANMLMAMANLAALQGDYQRALGTYREALALARSTGNRQQIARLLYNLGWLYQIQGEAVAATGLLEESLALSRELGDRRAQAAALQQLGSIARKLGEYHRATALLEECLGLTRAMGDRQRLADGLSELGQVAAEEQDYERARSLFVDGLAVHHELGDRRNVASLLVQLGSLAGRRGQGSRAARLWGAATALRAEIGAPLTEGQSAEFEHAVGPVRASCGESEFTAAWIAGGALPLEQAVAEALSP